MKQILLICAVVALVGGCASTPKVVPNSPEAKAAIEAAIRKAAKKPTGELTQADLEKVTKLNLGGNKLTDVKGLEKLTKLKELNLNNNQLTKVPKELEKLTKLTGLGLKDNKLTDVNGLEKLTQVKSLNLSNNQLNELPKGLEKLDQLTRLYLRGNPDLTKAQIAQLQKALPKCKIDSNTSK